MKPKLSSEIGKRSYGGSECTYSYVYRLINDDTRLSKKKKRELIESITMLTNSVIDDADFMIRNDYGSAHSSGIKYLEFDTFDEPSNLMKVIAGKDFRSVYATACLKNLGSLSSIRKRMKNTIDRLEGVDT